MVTRIKAYRKFRKGEHVVIVSGPIFRGEVGTVRISFRDRITVDVHGNFYNLPKDDVMLAEEAKKQAMQKQVTESMWGLMGGYPACMNCGCSPAEWEDGFPPYCHSCGARMTNGRK